MIIAFFLLAPLVLIAKLLGASWLVAITIGVCAPMAALVIAFVVALIATVIDDHKRKRRHAKRIEERRHRVASYDSVPPQRRSFFDE